jgi:hypothetical protein
MISIPMVGKGGLTARALMAAAREHNCTHHRLVEDFNLVHPCSPFHPSVRHFQPRAFKQIGPMPRARLCSSVRVLPQTPHSPISPEARRRALDIEHDLFQDRALRTAFNEAGAPPPSAPRRTTAGRLTGDGSPALTPLVQIRSWGEHQILAPGS